MHQFPVTLELAREELQCGVLNVQIEAHPAK